MRISQAMDFKGWIGIATWHQGIALTLLDQFREGMAQLREGIDIDMGVNVKLQIPMAFGYLAYALEQ